MPARTDFRKALARVKKPDPDDDGPISTAGVGHEFKAIYLPQFEAWLKAAQGIASQLPGKVNVAQTGSKAIKEWKPPYKLEAGINIASHATVSLHDFPNAARERMTPAFQALSDRLLGSKPDRITEGDVIKTLTDLTPGYLSLRPAGSRGKYGSLELKAQIIKGGRDKDVVIDCGFDATLWCSVNSPTTFYMISVEKKITVNEVAATLGLVKSECGGIPLEVHKGINGPVNGISLDFGAHHKLLDIPVVLNMDLLNSIKEVWKVS